MSGKYARLGQYLETLTSDKVTLAFGEMEKILGARLPPSARKYQEWWSNTNIPGRQSSTWLYLGWNAVNLDLTRQHVTFVRTGVSRLGERRSKKVRGALPSEAVFEGAKLKPSDFAPECSIGVDLAWWRLGSIELAGGKLLFPAAPACAGLYRMIVQRDGRSTIYVGEAKNLVRRFRNYRNPGNTQKTSLRINAFLLDVISAGGKVAIDVAYENVRLFISGKGSNADLNNKPVRRLLEQAAIVAHHGADVDFLNL